MVERGAKLVSWLWNQFQTSVTVTTRRVDQGCHRAPTSAHDQYLAISARRHRRATASQLARDFATVSGRRICRQTVHSRLANMCLYALCLV
ncbi:hypothetical protein TNCV_2740201 [Trichonephila clavipes]|nr:hypothetical protein TNCV_2740201 [Trichonephila clavipes]